MQYLFEKPYDINEHMSVGMFSLFPPSNTELQIYN